MFVADNGIVETASKGSIIVETRVMSRVQIIRRVSRSQLACKLVFHEQTNFKGFKGAFRGI